jgi:hypothetical protein
VSDRDVRLVLLCASYLDSLATSSSFAWRYVSTGKPGSRPPRRGFLFYGGSFRALEGALDRLRAFDPGGYRTIWAELIRVRKYDPERALSPDAKAALRKLSQLTPSNIWLPLEVAECAGLRNPTAYARPRKPQLRIETAPAPEYSAGIREVPESKSVTTSVSKTQMSIDPAAAVEAFQKEWRAQEKRSEGAYRDALRATVEEAREEFTDFQIARAPAKSTLAPKPSLRLWRRTDLSLRLEHHARERGYQSADELVAKRRGPAATLDETRRRRDLQEVVGLLYAEGFTQVAIARRVKRSDRAIRSMIERAA